MINKKIKGNAGQNNNAFSLIELSIVILIIAVLASSGLTIFKSTNAASKTKTTKDRIDTVYKAIGNYLLVNRRLPCPASLELDNTNASYGAEVRSPAITGTCPVSTSGGVIINTNLVYGMVPTKTLGLSSDMAEDGFGTKLSYVIDKRFATAVTSLGTDGFEGNDGRDSATIIQIRELSASGSNIITNGIMVIVSHGANKFGGFNSAGVFQNDLTSATTDEQDNAINSFVASPSLSGNFDNIFITNPSNTASDDILIFKNKTQLAIDADLESMLCRKAEATNYTTTSPCSIITFTWNKDANYGEKKNNSTGAACPAGCTPTNIPARVCEKYGIWGPVVYQCI